MHAMSPETWQSPASLDRRDLTIENKSFVEMSYDAFGVRGQVICHGIAQEKEI